MAIKTAAQARTITIAKAVTRRARLEAVIEAAIDATLADPEKGFSVVIPIYDVPPGLITKLRDDGYTVTTSLEGLKLEW